MGQNDKPEAAADEKKDMGEVPVMMGMPCSWDELEAAEEAGEMYKACETMTDRFKMMAENIMYNGAIEDKAAALSDLAKGYSERMAKIQKPGMMRKALNALGITKPEPQPELPALTIWKEADGTYRWIAAYSNNRRDDDNPPEIISSASHKEFDQALETKEYPMPEAWLWHVPFPVGVTQYHAFDEAAGFPIAAGVFYKGMEWAAEGIMSAGWDGVSHGMPSREIRRDDETDTTIITRHRTKEISFLPTWAAANKLAFNIITKEVDEMTEGKGLPAQKRQEFEKAFGAERVAQIESAIADKAKEADEAGIEKKEAEVEPVEVEEAEQPEAVAEQQAPDRSEIKAAFDAILGAIKDLEIRYDARFEALEKAREKEAEPVDLVAYIKAQSAIGKEETRVDGRKAEAKDGPEETQPKEKRGPTGIPVIDQFVIYNQEQVKQ